MSETPPEEFEATIAGAEAFGPAFETIPVPERLDVGTEAGEDDVALEFRRTLGMFATGVTVVAVKTGEEQVHGMTANAFMSVSLEPPLVSFCPARSSLTWTRMRATGRFGVTVLGLQHESFVLRATPAGARRGCSGSSPPPRRGSRSCATCMTISRVMPGRIDALSGGV